MDENMEYLIHYVWQHRIYGTAPLETTDHQSVEVVDVGVHNLCNSGPDFFNAKVKIDGLLWVGNVEVHERSSDCAHAGRQVVASVGAASARRVATQLSRTDR